jgi:hypothetical protein
MPGAYAHITLVNMFRGTNRLDKLAGMPAGAKSSLLKSFKFCELGAVSPDYPYLAVGDSDAAKWADLMHYTRTGEIVRAGIKHLRPLHEAVQRKCLTWLLGYCAHVVTDVTIHPIVEMKVGTYAANKTAHRICEMNQDAYIFPWLNLGNAGLSDHLESGIANCTDPSDDDLLDRDVVAIWNAILQEVHPAEYAANPPDIDKWHDGFNIVVETISETGNHLFPFARHLAADSGMLYPSYDGVDRQFIDNLATPIGRENYDAIFDRAIENVGSIWVSVANGVLKGDTTYLAKIGDWDLDTGRDSSNKLAFWG